ARPLPDDLGRFDRVVTNPPYLAAAVADPSPDRSKALATVESSADLARWLGMATAAAKPAATLLVIHRSDRLEEVVQHLGPPGWAGWAGATSRSGACRPPRACWYGPVVPTGRRDARHHRSRCIGPTAATPTRPRPSCAMPRRLPSEGAAATVPPCWVG